MMDEEERRINAELEAQRQRVLEELKKYDEMLCAVGWNGWEPRQPNDFLSHAVVVAAWHRMDPDHADSSAITTYRLTDAAAWACVGLYRAAQVYAEAELIEGSGPEDGPGGP